MNSTGKINLTKYRAVILDMDGVIYRGDQVLAGAKELIDRLRSNDQQILFLTNNSSKTPEQIIAKLAKMEILDVQAEQVLSSAIATGYWLKENAKANSKVFVFGGDGIKQQVIQNGFQLVDDESADYVISGLNINLTYEELTRATLSIQKGAKLIATNNDLSYPTERGLQPGAGSLLAVLTLSSGQQPVAILGKPSPDIFNLALQKLAVDHTECLMIGDRLDTDIKGAKEVGMDTVLVLTGVSSLGDVESTGIQPSSIVKDLGNL